MYAAYGTFMLLDVMICSTVLCLRLWLMSYNIMWLVHLVGILSVFYDSVCVGLVPLFFFLVISW